MSNLIVTDLEYTVELHGRTAASIYGGMPEGGSFWHDSRQHEQRRKEVEKAVKTAETAPQETVAETSVYITLGIVGTAI